MQETVGHVAYSSCGALNGKLRPKIILVHHQHPTHKPYHRAFALTILNLNQPPIQRGSAFVYNNS